MGTSTLADVGSVVRVTVQGSGLRFTGMVKGCPTPKSHPSLIASGLSRCWECSAKLGKLPGGPFLLPPKPSDTVSK